MTEEELRQLDTNLRQIASELGLDWMTDEVDRSIAEGYPEERLRRTSANGEWTSTFSTYQDQSKTSREKPIIVVRPMTSAEQVRQLAVALRVVLVDGPRKEAEMIKNLTDAGPGSLNISFVTENPRGVGEPETNDIASDITEQERLDALSNLFDQLIEQIDAPS